MKMLQHLNLSSNNLTGEVSKGGIFASLDSSEINGNIGLCSTWINFPPCSHSKHLSTSRKVIVPLVIGIAIFIMSIMLLAFSYRWRHANILALKVGPPRLLYKELLDATGGFSEENLLGIGSFGSVYKGILNNGTNIVVNVFNLHDEKVHQSFIRECNILKGVGHRNECGYLQQQITDSRICDVIPVPCVSVKKAVKLLKGSRNCKPTRSCVILVVYVCCFCQLVYSLSHPRVIVLLAALPRHYFFWLYLLCCQVHLDATKAT
ncbi:hypothetical protein KI387_025905, partial [Taxus chinensis]